MEIKIDRNAVKTAIRAALEGRNIVYADGSGHDPQVEVVLFSDGRVDAFFCYTDDFPCDSLAGEVASVKVDVGIDGGNIRYASEYAEISGILIYEAEAIFENGGKRAMEAEAEVDAYWSEDAIHDDSLVGRWTDEAIDSLEDRLFDIASAEELNNLDASYMEEMIPEEDGLDLDVSCLYEDEVA